MSCVSPIAPARDFALASKTLSWRTRPRSNAASRENSVAPLGQEAALFDRVVQAPPGVGDTALLGGADLRERALDRGGRGQESAEGEVRLRETQIPPAGRKEPPRLRRGLLEHSQPQELVHAREGRRRRGGIFERRTLEPGRPRDVAPGQSAHRGPAAPPRRAPRKCARPLRSSLRLRDSAPASTRAAARAETSR